MRFRSNSAKAPKIWKMSFPVEDIVSIDSCKLWNPIFFSSSFPTTHLFWHYSQPEFPQFLKFFIPSSSSSSTMWVYISVVLIWAWASVFWVIRRFFVSLYISVPNVWRKVWGCISLFISARFAYRFIITSVIDFPVLQRCENEIRFPCWSIFKPWNNRLQCRFIQPYVSVFSAFGILDAYLSSIPVYLIQPKPAFQLVVLPFLHYKLWAAESSVKHYIHHHPVSYARRVTGAGNVK